MNTNDDTPYLTDEDINFKSNRYGDLFFEESHDLKIRQEKATKDLEEFYNSTGTH